MKIIFLLVAFFYTYEISSLGLREEYRLIAFETTVLRRIFRSKGKESMRGERKMCNNELHDLYSSPNIIMMMKSKRMRLTRYMVQMG
jgi:hypothetical protein